MDARARLNQIYRPLHEQARSAQRTLKELGYPAALTYCNNHQVRVDGRYQTEWFPLPELEIRGPGLCADLGISLDGGAWLELTLPRAAALAADYPALAAACPSLEVYGAEDYLSDFCRPGMDPGKTAAAVAASAEEEVHVAFTLPDASLDSIRPLFGVLRRAGLLP